MPEKYMNFQRKYVDFVMNTSRKVMKHITDLFSFLNKRICIFLGTQHTLIFWITRYLVGLGFRLVHQVPDSKIMEVVP